MKPITSSSLTVCLIIIAVITAYDPSFRAHHGIDFYFIDNNPLMLEPSGWLELFFHSHTYPILVSNEFRPLTYISFWAQIQTTGFDPLPMHVFNLVVHLANVALIIHIVSKLIDRRTALIAASLLGLHPLMTEAVTNLIGRADLLTTAFALLAWALYLRARIQPKKVIKQLQLTGCILLLIASLLFKENGIAILGVILLFDLFAIHPRLPVSCHRNQLATHLLNNVYLWLSIPIYLILRLLLKGPMIISDPPALLDNPLAHFDAIGRILTAFWVMVKSWGLLVWPQALSIDYSFNQIPQVTLGDPRFLLVVTILIAMIGGAYWLKRRFDSGAWVFLTGFLILYLPTSNFLFPIGTVLGERTLYFPSTMILILAAWSISRATRASQWTRSAGWTGLLAVLVVFAFLTHRRNFDWESNETICSRQMVVAPNSARTWERMAVIAIKKKEYDQALNYLERGLKIMPEHGSLATLKGTALIELGHIQQGIESFERGLELGDANHFYFMTMVGRMRDMGLHDEVNSALKSMVRAYHPDRGYHRMLAQSLVDAGCHEMAAFFLQQWIDSPYDCVDPINVYMGLFSKDQPEETRRFLRARVNSGNEHPYLRLLLARIESRLGAKEEALYLYHTITDDQSLNPLWWQLAYSEIGKIQDLP